MGQEQDIDSQNMIGVVDGFSKQITEALELGQDVKAIGQMENIIIAGMGGSGHPGDMLKAYAEAIGLKIPVFVVRDYQLPEFTSSKTLVFAISYSGNTEETISSLKNAIRKGAKTVAITSGGKLRTIAEENKIPLILVPSGLQPRLAIAYQFIPLLNVLSNTGIIKNPTSELKKTAEFLSSSKSKAQSKELASKLTGKIPLIYSSSKLWIAAYIWKILINECAKTHGFCNVIPEMNHNEINAFRNLNAKFYAIFLQDEMESDRIGERMKISRDIISSSGVESTQLILKGNSFLTKLFTAIQTGMYVSYYLSISYNTDPSPVPVVEELKKRLKKRVS